MQKKQQPSKKIQAEIATHLTGYESNRNDLLDDLSRRGLRLLTQQMLEAEAEEHLGRGWYERRSADGPRTGYRNGYELRTLKTPAGTVTVQQPKLRGTPQPFRALLIKQLARLGYGLTRLATEMYVRGLSTRDIEETLVDEAGKPLLSRSTTSRVTDELYREYEAFTQRDLSDLDVVYLFADAVYESVRHYTNGQTLLCAWAILSDGRKVLLHLSAVTSESEVAWRQFFDEMLRRGLRHPLLVITDGATGLHAAISRAFPKANRQRCIAHKLRNIGAKLPKDTELRKLVLDGARAVYYATDRIAADALAAQFIERYTSDYPAAVKCFQDDLDACLMHLEYPPGHRRFIRTTNLIERAFLEEKRRTKTIPVHPNERGAMKLAFGVLLRTSRRWVHVSMTKLERTQLRNIRTLKDIIEDKNYISYRLAA